MSSVYLFFYYFIIGLCPYDDIQGPACGDQGVVLNNQPVFHQAG